MLRSTPCCPASAIVGTSGRLGTRSADATASARTLPPRTYPTAADAGEKQNITYAIGTQAGDDYILLYGSRSADSTAELADSLTPQITALSEDS